MRLGFYPKLAWTGIKKNKRLYYPYILTCIGMVMMYYIITFLSSSPLLKHMGGGGTLSVILMFGSFVIAVFALIFLFYTNSFLMRRRKKEFGLYNMLGMGKRNIGRILVWESLITAVLSLFIGLIAGIAFSKLAELGLMNIVDGDINLSFTISTKAIGQTLILFGIIYALILLNALRQVRSASAVALLRSESAGEKPPKANWILGILGFLLLAGAYYTAVSIKDPLGAFTWFFAAVLLVIVATYLLFIAGSVLLCRLLQKNKGYYYKLNHFVSVSSMVYRMKRNGAGLATICILATMVLVMITGSSCLYFGAEDSLRNRFPRDIVVDVDFNAVEDLREQNINPYRSKVEAMQKKHGTKADHILDYRFAHLMGILEDGVVETDRQKLESVTMDNYYQMIQFYFVPLTDYNRLMGTNKTLSNGEAMVYFTRGKFKSDTLSFKNGLSFDIVEVLKENIDNGNAKADILSSLFIIVPDFESTVEQLMPLRISEDDRVIRLYWYYGFDSDKDYAEQIVLQKQIYAMFREQLDVEGNTIYSFNVESLAANREDFLNTYGGLFFLGIMLSIVFIFATVLIIYYKQISEGYEDQSRFSIMQKVGMTKADIRKSINSQMLTVFFLPLAAAVLHLAFAFPMIRKLLILFNLHNLPLLLITAGISILIFAVFYVVVYRLTSNAYYSIVSGAREGEA